MDLRHLAPFALALGFVASGSLVSAAAGATVPVIIDTDMAVDDWMAMLFLLEKPGVDVLAVTVSGTGEAHCKPGVQNALGLLQLAGKPAVPVACGSSKPLAGSAVFPTEWRNGVDKMNGLKLPPNPNKPSSLTAVALLEKTLSDAAEPVTLVTLGPLTNIAQLLAKDAAVANKIAGITVMGGAVSVPGNLGVVKGNSSAEWNIYIDPTAAAAVIKSGIPVTLVALDATNHVPLSAEFYDKLKADQTTPAAQFAFSAVDTQHGFVGNGWFFWDPLAAAIAIDPSLATVKTEKLSVVTKKGNELGRTRPDDAGTPVAVAVDANAGAFYALFLDVLNGRGAN